MEQGDPTGSQTESGKVSKGRRALSPREREVLVLMAEGLSNHAIADRLELSLNTVRNHVQRIIGKLGVHSKLAAVTTALREGIIEVRRSKSEG